MTINHHNYEGFFIAYADAELSTAEMEQVDAFIGANPQLAEELALFTQLKFTPGNGAFTDAASLMRIDGLEQNAEENMLLLLHKELPAAEAALVQEAITNEPVLAAKWAQLKKTVLNANEQVVYEDKQALYRYEKTRVFTMRTARWAAAAMLLGLCSYIGFYLLNNQQPNVEHGVVITPTKPASNSNKVAQPTIPQLQNTTATQRDIAIAAQPQESASDTKNILPANTKTQVAPVTAANKKDVLTNQKSLAVTTQTAVKNNNSIVLPTADDKLIAAPLLANKGSKVVDKNINPKPETYELLDVTQTTNTRLALATNEPNSDTRIFGIDENDIERSKAGGLFKRVKRLVNGQPKNTGGKSIFIASFEIAVK